MPTISTTLPSDGETIDAADVNTPFNDILNVVNGNIDSDNLADDAVTTDKIADGAVTQDKLNAASLTGWLNLGATPNTITNNGNRSYDLVFNSNDLTDTLSEGMRLKLTRTTTAPTQSTSLNGTTQYWSKSSPAGTTFTDDFCAGAWVYPTSYSSGFVLSRIDGSSGWGLCIDGNGRVGIIGFNGSLSNFSEVRSYQSLPLNKWSYVSAQLDMSAFTATATTSYVMIDGVDVPSVVARGGTNPTALVQAGDLQVGARTGTEFFPGKVAQAWYSSAKITQANIRTFMSQGITTSDVSTHSIVSAFSFNGVATDINTTNANNLSAQGSAGYTSDSPFAGGSRSYDTAGTTEHAIVSAKPTFSTNTTVTVQIPEGHAIPTSGGISAVSYSTQENPYGFPVDKSRWVVQFTMRNSIAQSSPVNGTWYNLGSAKLNVPVGSWMLAHKGNAYTDRAVAGAVSVNVTLSTSSSSESDRDLTASSYHGNNTGFTAPYEITKFVSLSSATPYYKLHNTTRASGTNIQDAASDGTSLITAVPSSL